MTTYIQSTDDIFTSFNLHWTEVSQPVVGYVPEIRWFGLEPIELPDKSAYFVRASIRTIDEVQAALGVNYDNSGRMYRNRGIFLIQIHCPISDKTSAVKGRSIANAIKNRFRSLLTQNGVLFTAARIEELPYETDWYRFNIIAEYNYEDIG